MTLQKRSIRDAGIADVLAADRHRSRAFVIRKSHSRTFPVRFHSGISRSGGIRFLANRIIQRVNDIDFLASLSFRRAIAGTLVRAYASSVAGVETITRPEVSRQDRSASPEWRAEEPPEDLRSTAGAAASPPSGRR